MRTRLAVVSALIVFSALSFSSPTNSRAARGVVYRRISSCDYFVVATKANYDVLEWFGGHDPDRDDILVGDFESYGFHDIYDETTDDDSNVWTEDYALTKEHALETLTEKCE